MTIILDLQACLEIQALLHARASATPLHRRLHNHSHLTVVHQLLRTRQVLHLYTAVFGARLY